MPHTDTHWRTIISGLQATVEHERTAAREWMQVADTRLSYLRGFDQSLTSIIARAAKIEQVFNVGAPDPGLAAAPQGAGGEEVARLCRQKLRGMVNFVEALAEEALKVDRTLVDVFGLANEALRTERPVADLAPTNLAAELGVDWNEYEQDDSGYLDNEEEEDTQTVMTVSTHPPPKTAQTDLVRSGYEVASRSQEPGQEAGNQLLAFLGQSTPRPPQS